MIALIIAQLMGIVNTLHQFVFGIHEHLVHRPEITDLVLELRNPQPEAPGPQLYHHVPQQPPHLLCPFLTIFPHPLCNNQLNFVCQLPDHHPISYIGRLYGILHSIPTISLLSNTLRHRLPICSQKEIIDATFPPNHGTNH
ncbi:hypothetical protein CC2G_004826 [Coprinopsis cinerea AmutBmut pab1-1]|nr:hypothetical protein CC2G_004826 [Coprinopsis cinerea AmutBmut pab1-1]